MTPVRLQTIEEVFHQALDCKPDQVGAFLNKRCVGDKSLRGKVEALLTSHREAESFIQTSIGAAAASVIETEQTESLIGQTIDHYKISRRIGVGGMGEVYLALDLTASRRAALKLLPAHLIGDGERLKRFQQEARAVAGLNHPNILTVYEVGASESFQYIASELIEGETLRQRLARGRIEVGEALDIAIQIGGALAAAHSAGVVHRDIKPENIMLRPDGYVKVLDFGIAKLAEEESGADNRGSAEAGVLPVPLQDTSEFPGLSASRIETNLGLILGTVSYMSPEQARPGVRGIDKRTDIWSLAVVLYEMVAGRAPFTGDRPAQVMAAILAKELSPLSEDIPKARDELQQIVTKALRKDPSQRYQSANEMLDALKALRRKLELDADLKSRGSETASHPWLRWTTSPTAVALASLLGALALALPFYWLRNPTANLMPEKSIAVLPFENLSPDQDNAFFADGVQADILTKLAKVADLKVISRTSVMRYRGKQDMREIGRALGVSHLLEGTVRRSNGSVRINAQLIDARTDTHVWAEEYDRDLNEVFAIEAELAQAVADKLKAMISAPEKLALQDRPTKDLVAYDLYCDARQLALTISYGSDVGAKLLQAIDLLDQAVARDPSFFDAYCLLASAHNEIYFIGDDHSPGRLALAEKAVTAAARLRPDAGETHLARAENLYKGHLDYDNALDELEIARQTLPNNPRVSELQGYVERRRGRWDAAMQSLQRAADLDPRNIDILHQIALNSDHLRRYAHVKQALDRALAIDPNDLQTRAARAVLEYDWKADTRPLQQLIDEIRAKDPGSIRSIADGWLACALAERNPVAAQDALIAAGEDMPFNNQAVHFSHDFMKGVVARMKKDQNEAQTAFTAARIDQEKALKDQPEYAPAICVLGLIDAALGRHDDALREGRRAVALLPVEKDPINGALMIEYLAMIAAWAGNNDLAVEQLTIAIRLPGSLSYGQLKLDPSWDPLRGDPRFEQIVNSLAPK